MYVCNFKYSKSSGHSNVHQIIIAAANIWKTTENNQINANAHLSVHTNQQQQ